MQLPYWAAIELLGIYPREMKPCIHTKACPQMYTAALSMVDDNWNRPKYSSASEWWNKLLYIHEIEYITAIKKKN